MTVRIKEYDIMLVMKLRESCILCFSHIYLSFFRLLYVLFKLFPTQANKILFLSRQTDVPSIDFRMLQKELLKQNAELKIKTMTKRIKKTPQEIFFKNTPQMFRQMYHLATAKICVIDGYNIAVSVLKHKEALRVVQIWHSLGAIKKFGKASPKTVFEQKIAEIFHMHEGYDTIVCSSDVSAGFFAEAFGYEKKAVKICGSPRIDYLLGVAGGGYNRKKILEKYPKLKKRKNILYVPTFRNGQYEKMRELICAIGAKDFNLIVKLHPNIKLEYPKNKNVFECRDFSVLQLFSIADYVITDYSAVSFEAAVCNLPLYFYTYDLTQYEKNPGLNVNLKHEFPGFVFDDADELIKKISTGKYPKNLVKNYAKKYVAHLDTKNTERLAKIVLEELVYA